LPPCRSKPFVLNTVKNRLVQLLWTNFMGTFVRCPTFLMVQTFIIIRGMRGLPALIWEGSVLDAGMCNVSKPLLHYRHGS
jgi:hypothetical protein